MTTLMQYSPIITCDGCGKTLTLPSAPGNDMNDAIRAHGWNENEDGRHCPSCCTETGGTWATASNR